MNLDNTTIALIGLGYVGLPLAVEFGKHRPVIGFDINQARVTEHRSVYGSGDNLYGLPACFLTPA